MKYLAMVSFLVLSWTLAASADPLLGTVSRNSPVNRGAVLTIDDVAGTATFLGDPTLGSLGLSGLSFGPGGKLYGSTSDGFTATSRLYEIDPVTGAFIADIGDLALPGTPSTPIRIGSLAYDPISDTLLASAAGAPAGSGFIHAVDPATGLLTDTWGPAPEGLIGGLAFGPDGTLYATGFQTVSGSLERVLWEVTLGKPTSVFTLIAVLPFFVDSIAVRPSDGLIFAVPGGFTSGVQALYTIDPLTGVTSQFGPQFANGWGVSDLAFAPVPEPGTGLLLLVAMGAAAVVVRRRK